MKNILFISEDPLNKLDEGKRKITFNILQQLSVSGAYNIKILAPSIKDNYNFRHFKKNLLSVLKSLSYLTINSQKYDYLFYFPSGWFLNYRTYSFFSIFSIILKIKNWNIKCYTFSFQEKRINSFMVFIFSIYKPEKIFVLTPFNIKIVQHFGEKNFVVINGGVNLRSFSPISNHEKLKLREKYGIPKDKIIFTHVGHLTKNRGINKLFEITNLSENYYLFLVTSTLFNDYELQENKSSVKIEKTYIENIQEIYQLSDIYLYLVKEENGAIDFPLSVLEALSCGIPVITTKYRALNRLEGLKGIKFITEIANLNADINDLLIINKIEIAEQIKEYDWSVIVNSISEYL